MQKIFFKNIIPVFIKVIENKYKENKKIILFTSYRIRIYFKLTNIMILR